MTQLIAKGQRLYTPYAAITDSLQREWHAEPEPAWVTSSRTEPEPGDHRDPILIVQHAGGDHDTIRWPNPRREHLRSALFDAREMGLIPDEATVLLPDGTEFHIDA